MISELTNDRLTRTGRTRDQQVRHLRHVRDHEAALDVLAEAGHHRVVVVARGRRPDHVAEADDLLVGVRDLDADRGLARDRRQDPHVGRRHRVGDVLAQGGDLLDLHRRAELDLVAGDCRAAGVAGDLRVDAELLEHLGQPVDHRVGRLGPGLVDRTRLEHLPVGQRVRDVAGQAELLDPLRDRRVRRRLGRRFRLAGTTTGTDGDAEPRSPGGSGRLTVDVVRVLVQEPEPPWPCGLAWRSHVPRAPASRTA